MIISIIHLCNTEHFSSACLLLCSLSIVWAWSRPGSLEMCMDWTQSFSAWCQDQCVQCFSSSLWPRRYILFLHDNNSQYSAIIGVKRQMWSKLQEKNCYYWRDEFHSSIVNSYIGAITSGCGHCHLQPPFILSQFVTCHLSPEPVTSSTSDVSECRIRCSQLCPFCPVWSIQARGGRETQGSGEGRLCWRLFH